MAFSNAGVVVARRLIAGSIDVPGIGVTGFHVDSSGNLGIGGTTATTGNFTVTSQGIVTATALTVTSSLNTTTLNWGSSSSLTAGDAIDLPVQPANVKPGLRQSKGSTTTPPASTSMTVTGGWTSAPVAGNLLVAFFGWSGTNASTIAVSVAPAGWTAWVPGTVTQGVNTRAIAYWKIAAGADAAPTLVLGGTPTSEYNCIIAEYTGVAAAPVDGSASNNAAGLPISTGTTGATTQASEICVGFAYTQSNTGSWTLSGTSPFAATLRAAADNHSSCSLWDFTTTAIAGAGVRFEVTHGPAANYVAMVQTFKASAPVTPIAGHAQFIGVAHGTAASLAVVTPSATVVDLMPNYGSLTADVTIANTETVVIGATIPANFFLAGTTFQFLAYGQFVFAVGNATWRLRVGPTTLTGNICSTQTATNSANSNLMFLGQITVRTVGAGGTVVGNFQVHSRLGWTITPIIGPPTSVAVDTTVANRVELTFISGAAGASVAYQTATINLTKW